MTLRVINVFFDKITSFSTFFSVTSTCRIYSNLVSIAAVCSYLAVKKNRIEIESSFPPLIIRQKTLVKPPNSLSG